MAEANVFRTERVAKGVNLVRGVTLQEARAAFGNRMLEPERVHRFAQSEPEAFGRIIDSINFHTGVAVSKNRPLGEFVQGGVFRVSVKLGNEERIIEINEDKLVKAGKETDKPDILKRENSILLITGAYTIDQSGSAFTVVLDPKEMDNLAKYLRLYNKPSSDGWYEEIGGMPVGKASDSNVSNALYYYISSELGSVRRGYSYDFKGGKRVVLVGVGPGDRLGVLVQATDLKDLAQQAEKALAKPPNERTAEDEAATRRLVDAAKQQD